MKGLTLVKNRTPPPPEGLAPPTKAWFSRVVQEYRLEEHDLRLLQLAGEAWDSIQEARATLREKGSTFDDRFGCPRARPEVAIERDARIAFSRLITQLGFDEVAGPDAESKPLRFNSPGVKHYAGN